MGNLQASARTAPYLVLGLLAGLYAAQSITGSMVQTALPVVLRDAGIPLHTIGYLSALFLPWALKFLWAPLVDRFGSKRLWILVCQMGLIICFGVASFLPPATHLIPLSAVLFIMALIATTQDVATDALGVEATTPDTRAKASGASTGGAYLGFLIGAGVWLPVYAYAGWSASMWIMAGFIALSTVPALAAGRLATGMSTAAARPSFKAVIANRALMHGLVFLIVYQCGVRLGISMVGPFLVDAGISVAAIGLIKGAGAAVAGIVAAIAGAAITQLLGTRRALAAFALLNLLACGGLLAFAAKYVTGTELLVALLFLQNIAVAMSFVALYAAMMNWCAPGQVATDFAVLQSLDALLAIVMGSLAGILGRYVGYPAIFAVTTLFLVFAIYRSLRLTNEEASRHQTSPMLSQESAS
jgi:MFS transporter (putative signal transducer)